MTWHELPPSEVIERLNSSSSGMPKDAPKGKNRLFRRRETLEREAIKPIVTAPLLFLFAITALAAFVANEPAVGLLSLLSLGFSVLLWYMAHRYALEVRERCREKTDGFTRVIREGVLYLIANEDLVQGDVILLQKEDYVPADCRILSCNGLTVRESAALSGKAGSYEKSAETAVNTRYEDADNMLWAGSAVETGSCRAIVIEVGDTCRIAAFSEKQDALGDKKSFHALLGRLSFVISTSLLGFLFLTAVFSFTPLSRHGLFSDWLLIVSFAGASASELLCLIDTVSLGITLRRSRTVLMRRSSAVETLARVDTVMLRASLFHDSALDGVSDVILPDGKRQPLAIGLSPEGARILRNALVATGGVTAPASQSETVYGEKTLREHILSACEGASVVLNREPYTMVASGVTESGVSYGLFRRRDDLLLSITADARTVTSLSGFVYENDTIEALPEEKKEMLCAMLPEGDDRALYGVAIGYLKEIPDRRLNDETLRALLGGSLVYEGAFLFVMRKDSPTALQRALSPLGVSLTLIDTKASTDGVARMVAPTRREVFDAIRENKAAGHTVLLQGETLPDLALMKEADLSLTLGDAPDRKEPLSVTKDSEALLVQGTKAIRLFGDGLLLSRTSDAISEAIVHARSHFYRMSTVLSYLLTLLGIKPIFALASLFMESPAVTPMLFFLLGFVFDTLAVAALLLKPCREIRPPLEAKDQLRSFLASFITGLLSGGGMLLVMLLSLRDSPLPTEIYATVLLFAVSLFVFLTHYVSFEVGKRPTASLSLGTLLIVGGTLVLFLLIFTRGGFGKAGLLSLLLALGVYAVAEGIKRLVLLRKDPRKKPRKYTKKNKKISKKSDKPS